MLLLNRCVESILLRGLSAWGACPKYVEECNKLQRRMVGRVLNMFPFPLEPPASYRSRVGRAAGREIEKVVGWWGRKWMMRTLAWDAHIARDLCEQNKFAAGASSNEVKTSFSWAPVLSRWRDANWFRERRVIVKRGRHSDATSSRTHTRSIRSHVSLRWHDRVDYAKRMSG